MRTRFTNSYLADKRYVVRFVGLSPNPGRGILRALLEVLDQPYVAVHLVQLVE